jgi:signal transduction histidine kinase
MNSILGFAQLLDRAPLRADQQRGVQHILTAGRHLLRLINEVLDIARIESGRQQLSLEPVRLGAVLQEAMALSAETSSSSKLRISISAPNSRAMSFAVSMSTVLLMVIIMRFINSLASTSLTRTSSLSARSFTVMPSASVIVRVIGGGAAGADWALGAEGRSRLVCVGRDLPIGRCCPNGGRCCPKGGR